MVDKRLRRVVYWTPLPPELGRFKEGNGLFSSICWFSDYIYEGETSWWILSQVFSRDFSLFFAVYLLSSSYGSLFIHIKGFLSRIFSTHSSLELFIYYCSY